MCLCFVLTDKAHAQRCLPGTKGLRITAGMTDGFHTADKRNELGYHFGLGTDRYVNGCHKWVFGGEYLQKYYPYKDIRVPVSQFTAEGGYYYNFLSDANKVFLCYAGGSVLAGYETVNWGKSTLFDGSRLYAGTKPATLLASDDDGESWEIVKGLTDHPSAAEWNPGAAGLTLHTILGEIGRAHV